MNRGLFAPVNRTQRRVADAVPAREAKPLADRDRFEAALRDVGEAFLAPPLLRPIPRRATNPLLGPGSIFDAPEGSTDHEGATCD